MKQIVFYNNIANMERLTLNKRQKTTGDKIDCIPAGDGLPVWETISLDAKLPMMSNPKGSVVLFTTKLGEPKHKCKQEHDFDLRDPNGQYVCNEYQPLHDPHLKYHFSTNMMRRHLIKKGFISENGKVLCSLREFNQYRQYLRHIYFLEIAKDRKEELEKRLGQSNGKAEVQRKVSRGTVVRKRLQQQKERDLTNLKTHMDTKSANLECRLREIRDEMTQRERKQRQEAERRQYAVFKHQQENEQRKIMIIKRWHQRDRMKRKLIEDRETQKKIKAELKCMAKWNARKNAQRDMLKQYDELLKEDEEDIAMNITKREHATSKKWGRIEKKLERLKQKSREDKQKKDEKYFKRLDEKLASGDYRIYSRRKDRRRSPKKTFYSTWKLQDVLSTFEVPDYQKRRSDPELLAMLNAAIDGAVDIVTKPDQEDDEEIQQQARNLVQDVISKVKNDIYPQYLLMIEDDMKGENEALRSKSVRFSSDEEEIKTDLGPPVNIITSAESLTRDHVRFKPVSEHVLTPCASQLEVTKLEAEAILGSPEVGDKITSISFVETLLLRLLDDLNSGRLSKEDIMKLASYSMEIIQSAELDTSKDNVIVEVPEDSDSEGPYLASSSCSVIAKKMVDFTLSKILRDIKSGNIHHDDLASLTVSFMDNLASGESSVSVSVSEGELDAYIEETIQRAATSATDPSEDSPVCEALLDDFMVVTLKALIQDLEEEILTKEQVKALATSVKEETRQIISSDSDAEVKEREDIQNILQNVLSEMQSGAIDFQKMYQVVSAIVYSYSIIKAPSDSFNANTITTLLRDVLNLVETKAGDFEDLNLNIVHEANRRLSHSALDSKQVEELSTSVASVVVKPEIYSPEMAKSAVEDALVKAKDKIENEQTDADLRQNVMDVAEAVINTLTEDRESPFVDVFLEVLKQLKSIVDDIGDIDDLSGGDIDTLIKLISSHEISENVVLEMAATVARVVRSPVQSDSSFAASLAVKDSLKVALNDLQNHNGKESFLTDIMYALKSCCNAFEFTVRKTPAFLHSLAGFLRQVLDHLTYKIQTGELNDDDVTELSNMVKNKMKGTSVNSKNVSTEPRPDTVDKEAQKAFEPTDATEMLNFIHEFIDATEENGLITETTETKEVGHKLIELGRRLVGMFAEKADTVSSASTDHFVESVVEEVIRNLKIEIDSGMLSKESLKEVTKAIIETASISDIASEAVGHTLRGIQRDFERGYMPADIDSVPTLADSPSASTIASHIVHQTIESITRDISHRGIPRELISSFASSVVTALSGHEHAIENLPLELKQFKPTISNIIDCLKRDQISLSYAEEMFCLILKHYKECVSSQKEHIEDSLSEDDVDIVSNLVTETLRHIERSIAKGRISEKAFSIPSLPQSDDTSVIAEHLVDSCLGNIKKSKINEKAFSIPSMPNSEDTSAVASRIVKSCLDYIRRDATPDKKESDQPKPDIINFILEIVTRLQSELEEGTISKLSMAHFFQAISDEEVDMRSLEMNATDNLKKVVENIRQFKDRSEYVHRILETYLLPNKSDEVFGDPLKAIESILVNVSSDILTKFVKATLQTILMGMRDEGEYLQERSPSVYVLRSASSIIADNVIKEVLERINKDMIKKVHKIHGTVSKQDIERAASRLLSESPRDTYKKSSTAVIGKKQSMSSVVSREIEDIVLETLHNIVSNLRLEQSIRSQKGSKPGSDSSLSQEIEDFVLNTLQNIVVDHQDRRSQMDMGVTRSGSKYVASSVELVTGESKEAMVYVNEVLQSVLTEMKAELIDQTVGSSEKSSDADSASVQTLILEYLQRALNDSDGLETLDKAIELFSLEDVKKVLSETIEGTINNIRENRFASSDLAVMFETAMRFFDEADPGFEMNEDDAMTPELVMNLLEQVKIRIESIEIQKKTLDKISSQLATLGMNVTSELSTPENIASESSVASSQIRELVKDVLKRISEQLCEETNADALKPKGEDTEAKDGSSSDTSKTLSNSSSKSSDTKKDTNYNRKLSVSSADSCTSMVTSDGNRSFDEHSAKKNGNSGNESITLHRTGVNKTDKRQDRKLPRRSTESRPVIRQTMTPSKIEHTTKTDWTNSLKSNIRQTPEEQRRPKLVCYTPKAPSKEKKNMSKENSTKPCVKASISEKKTASQKYATPTISSSAYTKKSDGTRKTVQKSLIANKNNVKCNLKQANKDSKKEDIIAVDKDAPLVPLELKSLCGVHKTKICYKEQVNDSAIDGSESDGNVSSTN